jgi:hypothetical protein
MKTCPWQIFPFSFQGFYKFQRDTGHFCKILKFEIDLSTLEKEAVRLFLGLRIQPPQIQEELQCVPYTLHKAPQEILEVYLGGYLVSCICVKTRREVISYADSLSGGENLHLKMNHT